MRLSLLVLLLLFISSCGITNQVMPHDNTESEEISYDALDIMKINTVIFNINDDSKNGLGNNLNGNYALYSEKEDTYYFIDYSNQDRDDWHEDFYYLTSKDLLSATIYHTATEPLELKETNENILVKSKQIESENATFYWHVVKNNSMISMYEPIFSEDTSSSFSYGINQILGSGENFIFTLQNEPSKLFIINDYDENKIFDLFEENDLATILEDYCITLDIPNAEVQINKDSIFFVKDNYL